MMVRLDLALYSGVFLFVFSLFFQYSFAAEDSGTISILLTYDTGSKATFSDMSLKIFKNSESVPFKEIPVQSNPVEISDLPLNHKYKIEAYFKDLYQDVMYYDLKQTKTDYVFPIKSPGGIKLGIFFKDNETPIQNADVIVKTMGGNIVQQDKTDINGNTLVFWLPQTLRGEYYDIDVVIDPAIKFSYKKLQVTSFVQQDIKIVTSWPSIIDSIIPIEVYKDEKTKVSKLDGNYIIQVIDKKKNKISESPVSTRGDANITNVPVGTYAFHVISEEGKILASKKVSLYGNISPIKIFLHDPQLNADSLYCNCVAFRFDDFQDNYLNNAQLQMLKLTGEMNAGISIGVIGGVIGNDKILVDAVKEQLARNPKFEVANHSLNNRVVTGMSLKDQNDYINKTDHKIQELFNVKPAVFIPPENLFDKQTISLLKQYGYGHLSSSIDEDPTAKFEESDFYHFNAGASTAKLDPSTGRWNHFTKDQILEQISDSLFDYGYAVVMMHPNEFSNYENGIYVNVANQTKFSELKSLISDLKSKGYLLTPIGKIDKYKTEKFESTVPIVIDDRNKSNSKHCYCVAFKIDNIQDYWINDVQNEVIDTFSKTNSPVTISIIGKFFGTDPKSVDFIKEKLTHNHDIAVAIRGWEIIDHSLYNNQEQTESIRLTNDQITKILGIKSNLFSPPFGKFNDNTLDALNKNKILYMSGTITTDKPSFKSKPYHVPETSSLESMFNDPFDKGILVDKFLQNIEIQQNQYGFALVGMQPSDFALRDENGIIINQINTERIQELENLINYLKRQNIKIVLISDVPLEVSFKIYPSWITQVYEWNNQELVTDKDLENMLDNLISRKIVIPA